MYLRKFSSYLLSAKSELQRFDKVRPLMIPAKFRLPAILLISIEGFPLDHNHSIYNWRGTSKDFFFGGM